MRITFQVLLLAVCVCGGIAPVAAIDLSQRIRLTDLGPGVKPTAINDNGQVVGQDATGKAFRWENGVFTALGTLGGNQSFANDINNSGVVVGWAHDVAGKMKSFRYGWQGNGMQNLDATVTFEGAAEGIDHSGKIVGWRTNGNSFRSVLWNPANATIDTGEIIFSSSNHKLVGINDSGNAVGLTLSANREPTEGFYWDGNDITEITEIIGSSYFPTAGINNLGVTAGIQDGAEFFRMGDVISSSIPANVPSEALGLNSLNLIVGESALNGFIYDLNSKTFFNVNEFDHSGMQLEAIIRLTDISNHDEFVGIGLVNGVEHGVYGYLTPVQLGDFDDDGDVDGRDFLEWQRNPSVGNLTDWQVNYGVGSLSQLTTIPEPTAIVLLTLGALGLFSRQSP